MLYLKACPECHGDIELVTYPDDKHSKTLQCLQCSFSVETNDDKLAHEAKTRRKT